MTRSLWKDLRGGWVESRDRLSWRDPIRPKSAEGSLSMFNIRTAPQQERPHPPIRRGIACDFENRTAPQRERSDVQSAEGSLNRNRTDPNLRDVQNSCSVTASAIEPPCGAKVRCARIMLLLRRCASLAAYCLRLNTSAFGLKPKFHALHDFAYSLKLDLEKGAVLSPKSTEGSRSMFNILHHATAKAIARSPQRSDSTKSAGG